MVLVSVDYAQRRCIILTPFSCHFFIAGLFVSGITSDQAKQCCHTVNITSDAASSSIGAVLCEMWPKE
jgi:hypothetical protein